MGKGRKVLLVGGQGGSKEAALRPGAPSLQLSPRDPLQPRSPAHCKVPWQGWGMGRAGEKQAKGGCPGLLHPHKTQKHTLTPSPTNVHTHIPSKHAHLYIPPTHTHHPFPNMPTPPKARSDPEKPARGQVRHLRWVGRVVVGGGCRCPPGYREGLKRQRPGGGGHPGGAGEEGEP